MSRKLCIRLFAMLLALGLLCQPLAVGSDVGPDLGNTPVTTPLIAAKSVAIGTLSVEYQGGNLVVGYAVTEPGWSLAATHLYVGEGLPAKTAPGSFPFGHAGLAGQTDSYTIPLADLGLVAGDAFYVVAQADVVTAAGEAEGAWASGPCLLKDVAQGGGWGTYFRAVLVLPVTNQGCTPGYWMYHTASWPPTGYSPSQSVASVFPSAGGYPAQGSATLLQALSFAGGPGVEGAVEILLRAGVAALSNASHPGVSYPRTPAQVIVQVDAALASGNRDTMLVLAASLDADNNLGCPLY